jgi:tetratricopeptide (TPR) repeat protein
MWFSCLNKFPRFILLMLFGMQFVKGSNASVPQVWNVPAQNPNFVGRVDLLSSIQDLLQSTEIKVSVISGPSGFGKSQIAKQYVYQNYTNYDVVWWFKGNQYLDPQFENFALALDPFLKLGISEKIKTIGHNRLVEIVKDAIRIKGVKCLIIFDDVQVFKDVESYIPFTHEKNIHILVTTKNANFSDKAFRLKPFQREESLEYIQRFLPLESFEAQESLAKHFSDCPSSLAMAIDYIKNYPGMCIESYLKRHDTEAKSSPKLLQEAALRLGSSIDGYEMDLLNALKMNLNELKQRSRIAFQLVAFLSLLHHDAIAADEIQKWLNEQKSDLGALELIHMVNQYSLLDTGSSTNGNGNLKMHELIQKIVGSIIPVEEKKKQIEIGVKILRESFADRTDQITERIIKDNTPLLHAMKLSEEAHKIHYHSPELTSLRIKAFDVLVGHVRDHEQSKIMLSHLEEDLKNGPILSKEDEIIFNTTRFLYSLVFSPDYENGIGFGRRAFELIEEEEGMYEEKIRLYSNLLQYCSLTGQLENSHKYVEKGQLCFSLSQSKAYNALFIFAVAMFQNDCGAYEKTIELINSNQYLLEIQESYPSIRFFVLTQLAEAYAKNGDVKKSMETLAFAEKLGRDYYPHEDNSFFGKWYLLKTLCQLSQPQTCEDAKDNLSKALKIFEKIYLGSDKHRNQGLTHLLMGKFYHSQKQYDLAKEHFLKSEKVYTKLLKNNGIEDVSELYKCLAILGADSKDEVLTHKYLKKHIEVFGVDHNRTKEIMVYLDEKRLGVPV